MGTGRASFLGNKSVACVRFRGGAIVPFPASPEKGVIMSLDSKKIFESLRAEGLPLFLTFVLAFPLLGAPSERALRMAVRRGKCPIPLRDGPTGGKGFKLAEIAAHMADEEEKRARRRPTKEEEIAARGQK